MPTLVKWTKRCTLSAPVVREDAHLLYGLRPKKRNGSFKLDLSLWDWTCLSSGYHCCGWQCGAWSKPSSKNITYLTKFPKIGKKTAQQMVLDLEGKINLDLEDVPAQLKPKLQKKIKPWRSYGSYVGIKATELKKIKKGLSKETTDTAENYIKSALKMLVK